MVNLWLIYCLLTAPMGVCRAEIATGFELEDPVLSTGWSSQYSLGVMERVVKYQQRRGRLPSDVSRFDGFVAVQSCSDVGRVFLLRPLGSLRWETFIAADCSGSVETTAWMVRNNILVEVDHKTAERWRTVGRGVKIELLKWR